MEMLILNMGRGKEKEKGFYLRVTEREAQRLIQSLIGQIVAKSPNVDRLENYTNKGEYVTIAVIPDEASYE